MKEIPIQDKYMLSIKEASIYFNIGMKKLRRMAEDNDGEFALYFGNRFLICRPRFEEYLVGLMKKPVGVEVASDEEIYNK